MKGFLQSNSFMSSTKGFQSGKGFLHPAKGFQLGSNVNLKQLLIRNEDIVWSGGIEQLSTDISIYAYPTLQKNNLSSIRQTGKIEYIKMFVTAAASPILFRVWRKNGNNYDVVFSENITSKLQTNTPSVVSFDNCIVEEGDYIGFIYDDFTSSVAMGSVVGVDGSYRYCTAAAYVDGVSDVNLDTQMAGSLPKVLTVPTYSQAPLAVIIGDSIAAGHPLNQSGVQDSLIHNPLNCISKQMYLLDNKYIIQNMGIISESTTHIKDRFTSHVINLKPKIAIIEGGINDIQYSFTKETFLSNYITMLDACVTANIIPVVCKITPWTSGTNIQLQTRDNWMVDLKALVDTYQSSVWISFDEMGQFRESGDVGNLWDIIETFNYDGTHFNLGGNVKMAEIIDREIKKKYKI